jgi:hypothetical protein
VTTAAIHQPEYFPWLGFLDKARRADVLVLLDDAQFDRSSLQHRARLAGANGLLWLTLPFVHRFPQRIDEVELAGDRWRGKHWKSVVSAYGRAAGFPDAAPVLEAFFARPFARLVDVTVASVELLLAAFGVTTRVVRSSALGVPGARAARVLALCRALGATRYLSGRTGASYLDAAAFAEAGVAVEVQAFTAPDVPRPRPLPEGTRGLSALDAWLCAGAAAPALLEAA